MIMADHGDGTTAAVNAQPEDMAPNGNGIDSSDVGAGHHHALDNVLHDLEVCALQRLEDLNRTCVEL